MNRRFAPRTARFRAGLAGLLIAGVAALASAAAPVRASDPSIVVLPATGVVDAAFAGYLADGVAGAAADGARAVIVELDTPGGSLDSTADITTAFLEAEVPVIVWVAPAGGRAASAGTFISLAANLLFMAPGTNIGAASPIDSSGADIPGTLVVKVLNDAVAHITSIAQTRGRPVDWAVSTVAQAKSYSAADAVAAGAADGIATTLDDVIAAANGRTVTVGKAAVVLALAGLPIRTQEMNLLQILLHLLSDPNIAFILFVLGVAGLVTEFFATNLVTGVLGAISIVLAFVGFGSLPLNFAGLVIVAIGVVLVLFEAHLPSHGLLTGGAAACVAIGAGMLYAAPGEPTMPNESVALPVIATISGLMLLFGALIAVTAMRTRRMVPSPHLVGSLQVVGESGLVRRPIAPPDAPLGSVFAAGEEWSATSADGRRLERDDRVTVVGRDGLVLLVEPTAADRLPATPA